MKTLLALCRASNLPTVWMNVLTAVVLGGSLAHLAPSPQLAILIALSMSCFYCGGMALNDVCDIGYDTLHQPYRPIPSGRISAARARLVTAALFGIGFLALALTAGARALWPGFALFGVICIYDLYHKRHAVTVLAMSGARLLVYVVAASSLDGANWQLVLPAAFLQAFYVLVLTWVARRENRTAASRYGWPVIPWMIAAMPLIDGALLAWCIHPAWLAAGAAGTVATRLGQLYVRGD